MRSLLAGLLIGAALLGCATPGRDRAVERARQELLGRGWKDLELLDATPRGGGWEVSYWRLPKTPGGHATVVVDAEGKVVEVIPGR